jgi:hypothetical protein
LIHAQKPAVILEERENRAPSKMNWRCMSLTRRAICYSILGAAVARPAEVPVSSPLFRLGNPLHVDDFAHGLEHWTAETEKPGVVEAKNGAMNIDVPACCTVWFKPELKGAVLIQYQATMVQAGGPHDRVSDLNCFWMATDSRSPDDLFATRRSGKFSDYDRLRTYYVGQGGNANSTTRFRRYIGTQDLRPLLPEHDLRTPEFLLKPNVTQTIDLVAFGKRVQYYRDGKLIFDYTDADPYTHGNFALRTTKSHVEIRRFRVYRLNAGK